MRWARLLLTLAIAWALAPSAHGHKASDAYLQLARTDSGVSLRVDVALRDLDQPLDLDADGNAALTWAEVKAAWPAIAAYVQANVRLDGCALQLADQGLERRSDGAYAVLWWVSACAPRAAPSLGYTLFAGIDPTHRGLLKVQWQGATTLEVLDPSRPNAPAAALPTPGGTARFLGEGIRHIVTGFDHVLFLLCLLLPAVMRRTRDGWLPVARLREALWPVAGIVTSFTLAHSITLTLAALKVVSLPSSFIEPAIAATIVLAAVDNVRPIFFGHRGWVTFAFGLVHGFGFAGVLAELELPVAQFAWALFEFNVGLELGQLAIVMLVTALLFVVRGQPRYPAWAIRGGSFAAFAFGVVWFIERIADVSLLPW